MVMIVMRLDHRVRDLAQLVGGHAGSLDQVELQMLGQLAASILIGSIAVRPLPECNAMPTHRFFLCRRLRW